MFPFVGCDSNRIALTETVVDVVQLTNDRDDIIFATESGLNDLWAQVYYIEGVCEPYLAEASKGVLYGAARVEIAPIEKYSMLHCQ